MTARPISDDAVDTVVIGAGQAGLAVAHHLARERIDFAVLEAAPRIGESWRTRWDSLKLFTPAVFNNLPGMAFPSRRSWHFPNKDEVADYLEAYARRFELPVRLGVKVDRLAGGADGGFALETSAGPIAARNVVVATGPFQKPFTPPFAGELAPEIRQLHSADYRNPGQLPAGPALVVGAASSGCEIAVELAKSRKVYLAGRPVPSIPALARRTVLRWIASQPADTKIGAKLYAKARSGAGHPLIGFGYKRVLKAGVERVGRVERVEGGRPVVEGGRALEVASVIWSTGWRLDFSWIDLPVFEADGTPRHRRGVVQGVSGLYFVGLTFLHSLSSQLLLGAARDSLYVADQLLRQRRTPGAARGGEPTFQAGGSRA